MKFWNTEFVVAVLAVAGLIGFGKDIAAGVRMARQYALTAEGAAMLRVVTALMVAAILILQLGRL